MRRAIIKEADAQGVCPRPRCPVAMPISPYFVYPLPRDILRAADACKVWEGTYDSNGYPRYKSAGRSWYVHRAVYEDFHGRLQPGEKVYRVCGDKRCINAMHLVTTKPTATGKRRRPGTAKLTPRRVRAIREAWAGPDRPSQAALARQHKVSRSAISLVVRGVTWPDVLVPVGMQDVATVAPAPPLSALEVLLSRIVRSA